MPLLSCYRSFEPSARLSKPSQSQMVHRTNRLSDRRLAITCSRISSGSIDMPPSGVTRRECRLLSAIMNARSLACSLPDLLSRQMNSMHRRNKFIPLSVAHDPWNASSAKKQKMSWLFRPAHPMVTAVEPVNSISEAGSGSRFVAFFLRSAGTER